MFILCSCAFLTYILFNMIRQEISVIKFEKKWSMSPAKLPHNIIKKLNECDNNMANKIEIERIIKNLCK